VVVHVAALPRCGQEEAASRYALLGSGYRAFAKTIENEIDGAWRRSAFVTDASLPSRSVLELEGWPSGSSGLRHRSWKTNGGVSS